MFPIPWNFPLIKKSGERTTIGAAIANAGSVYTLPTASADTKGGVKIGNGLTMTGEVLSVSGGGSKLYVKEFTSGMADKQELVSGKIYRWKLTGIAVDGYTPIFATCNDKYSGYWMGFLGISTEYNSGTPNRLPVVQILTGYSGNSDDFPTPIKVYYAKNEDIETLS